jgi:RNase P/RNase MRP subunit p29
MNLVGQSVFVVGASDPTMAGLRGVVVLETARTLVLQEDTKYLRIQKKGTVLMLADSKENIAGDDIQGRLEDRLRANKG